MPQRREPRNPFPVRSTSPVGGALTSPTALGAVTALALAAAEKLGRSPVPWDSLPGSITRLPRAALLVALGFPVGYLAGKSAEWARGKILQSLLAYQGWVDAPRSNKTKMWAVLMKLLKGTPDNTYSYQRHLPKQPLPDLDQTLDLWLQVSCHIVDKEEFEQTKEAVERFRQNEGPKIQAYLKQRYTKTVNWLSEYWLTAAYLSSREPLAIYSNYFLVNKRPDHVSCDQLGRGSTAIYSAILFYEMVARNKLAPLQLQDMVPICMNGYRHIYNSVRVPEENLDRLMRFPGHTHIVVVRKGQYYRLEAYTTDGGKKRRLRPEEIRLQLERICADAEKQDDVLPVAALTSLNRTKWAKLRANLQEKNAETLNTVESSLFLITLDDQQPEDIHEYAKLALTGRGGDRWFDKGFCCVVWPSSVFGCNVEHTGVDATVFGSVAEYLMVRESMADSYQMTTPADSSSRLEQPSRLRWDVDYMETEITTAYTEYTQLSDKMDLYVLNAPYGKGFMKKCKLSPDGFVQMALQLAYYKMYKETPKTYEPSTGRLYALGRTENIHPVSTLSKAWVRAMLDADSTRQSRKDLLRRAVSAQNTARLRATVGQGCDRHLLGLYCASRELGMDTPALFMDKAWRAPFKLSTSQTPTRTYDLGTDMDFPWVIGGFGPGCQDGYGLSYVVLGDECLNIQISSWKDCDTTSSTKMAAAITDAFNEMKELYV